MITWISFRYCRAGWMHYIRSSVILVREQSGTRQSYIRRIEFAEKVIADAGQYQSITC